MTPSPPTRTNPIGTDHRRVLPRLLATFTAALLLVLGSAAAASAHVTVNPNVADQGGYAKLTFRVPTEVDNASTTKLQVFLPTAHPISSVSVQPHPGWKFHVKTVKLTKPITTDGGTLSQAVSQITWRSDSPASAIKPGEFAEFAISAGPLPQVASMDFKALQTYSNGQVVRWIQSRTAGAAGPEHPAPVLTLSPADATSASPAATPVDTWNGQTTTALVLAIIALVVALASGAGGLLGRRRS